MKRILFSGFALMSASLIAFAGPLTPEEALARVSAQGNGAKVMSTNGVGAPELVLTAATEQGAPAVYVFNKGNDHGYILVSADDQAYPLLGYADNGSFDAASIPPAMKWWLDEYARQIEYASTVTPVDPAFSLESARLKSARADREAIAPMVKTMWDQIEPFNNMCPLYGDIYHTYTGCVATAMAQVMKYWNYPQVGKGSISYNSESIQKKLTMDFSAKEFDWANMLNEYIAGEYDETQADAVAYLMKACGYGVKMDYSMDASGALSMNIRRALVDFFDYDGNTRYELRALYPTSEWETMIYDNLKNVGPIVYGGSSLIGGGHSFVCDGYDGNGYFHFNWGWTGMSDGYFSLDALTPEALGTGGGYGGGYTFTQDAVLGIQPPTGEPVEEQPLYLVQSGSLAGSISGSTLTFSLTSVADPVWINYSAVNQRAQFGAVIVPAAGGESVYAEVSSRTITLKPGYGIGTAAVQPKLDLSTLDLADGIYNISICSRHGESSQWVKCPVVYPLLDHVTVVKNGNSYTVSNYDPNRLVIFDGGFVGTVYYGCTTPIRLEIENSSDQELSSGFAPVLTDGTQLVMLGQSVYVTVPADDMVEVEWEVNLQPLVQNLNIYEPTTFYMTFIDEETYNVYTEDYLRPVVIEPNPGRPEIILSETPRVVGANRRYENYNGTTLEVNEVTDPMNMPVKTTLEIENGYFSYPVQAALARESAEMAGQVEIVTRSGHNVTLDAEEDFDYEFTATMSYPQMEEDFVYNLLIIYEAGGSFYQIEGGRPTFVQLIKSGVDNVSADKGELTMYLLDGKVYAGSKADIVSLEAYSVSGALVSAKAEINGNAATLSLDELPAGVYLVTLRDAAGNQRTAKFAL